jgi:DNA transformation protein
VTAISALKNLGPRSAEQLAAVGITTAEELDAAGSLEAYRRLKAAFPADITLVMLYSLEGALLDCHWNDLPPGVKERLQRDAATVR